MDDDGEVVKRETPVSEEQSEGLSTGVSTWLSNVKCMFTKVYSYLS